MIVVKGAEMAEEARVYIQEHEERETDLTQREVLDKLDRLARQIAADWQSPRSAVELIAEQRR